jgi:hypothetical protein
MLAHHFSRVVLARRRAGALMGLTLCRGTQGRVVNGTAQSGWKTVK